ncbi:23237_t:CDS:2, partial [Racocetra persica]
KCKHGHTWVASYHIKYDKTWCAKYEQDKTRLNISIPKEIAQNRNEKCISDTYISNRSLLIWECEKSHRWVQTLTNIRKRHWCLYCSGNALLSLEIAEQIALSRHGQYLLTKYQNIDGLLTWSCSSPSKIRKPNFLKTQEYPTRLELDIPYYDLGFMIEVQGEQHWRRIEFFHPKPGDFEKQLERDHLKRDLCDENNIYLFYVWYDDEDPEKTIQDKL